MNWLLLDFILGPLGYLQKEKKEVPQVGGALRALLQWLKIPPRTPCGGWCAAIGLQAKKGSKKESQSPVSQKLLIPEQPEKRRRKASVGLCVCLLALRARLLRFTRNLRGTKVPPRYQPRLSTSQKSLAMVREPKKRDTRENQPIGTASSDLLTKITNPFRITNPIQRKKSETVKKCNLSMHNAGPMLQLLTNQRLRGRASSTIVEPDYNRV